MICNEFKLCTKKVEIAYALPWDKMIWTVPSCLEMQAIENHIARISRQFKTKYQTYTFFPPLKSWPDFVCIILLAPNVFINGVYWTQSLWTNTDKPSYVIISIKGHLPLAATFSMSPEPIYKCKWTCIKGPAVLSSQVFFVSLGKENARLPEAISVNERDAGIWCITSMYNTSGA